MTRFVLAVLSVTFSIPAIAGSHSIDCANSNETIIMGAGNSSNQVRIRYTDGSGATAVHEAPVKIMPEFDYNTDQTPQTITAIPIAQGVILSETNEVMHVRHKDGSSCFGRQRWDIASRQSYVLTSDHGRSLRSGGALPDRLREVRLPGMINQGDYLIAEFQCHDTGITTAGGCFAEDGDEVSWEPATRLFGMGAMIGMGDNPARK